jgi:hypothetical protein
MINEGHHNASPAENDRRKVFERNARRGYPRRDAQLTRYES